MTGRMSFTYPTHPKDFTPCRRETPRATIMLPPYPSEPHALPQIRFLPCEVQSGLAHDIEKHHCPFCKVYLK